MINITSLFSYIEQFQFSSENNNINYMSVYGSGMNMVFKEFANSNSAKNTIYVDLTDAIEITETNVLNKINDSIIEFISTKANFKIKDFSFDNTSAYTLYKSYQDFNTRFLKDNNLTLILDNFDITKNLKTYFFDFLNKLNDLEIDNKKSFNFIFVNNTLWDKNQFIRLLGDFYDNFFRNIKFVYGFKHEEIAEALNEVVDNHHDVAQKIYELTGGIPSMVNRILDIIGEKITLGEFDFGPEVFIKDSQVYKQLDKIWSSFTPQQKEYFSHDKNIYEDSFDFEFLRETKLIVKNNDSKYQNNFNLIKSYLSLNNHKNIIQDSQQLNTKVTETSDKFSPQEYSVYNHFKSNPKKLITKEEISKIMWGNKRSDKKSYWAIDQLMKRLRERIGDSDASIIQTVRGRGYRFEQ